MEQRVRVPLPRPYREEMRSQVEQAVSKKMGAKFTLQSVDNSVGEGVFVRVTDTTTADALPQAGGAANGKRILLAPSEATPGGEKAAARVAEDFPGYVIHTYEPHLGRAVIAKMSPDLVGARAALAQALGVKPWDVAVRPRRGGGYTITRIPTSYTPTKHDAKLLEAAQHLVPGGKPGWFVRVNGQTLTGEVVPAELPTFPKVIPAPLNKLGANVNSSPFGVALPESGQKEGAPLAIDWTASHSVLLGGMGGSGKRQPLYSRIPVPVSEKYPDGWATMESITPGDEVFAGPGDVTCVVGKSAHVKRPTYRFHFADGQHVDSDVEHLWVASTHASRSEATRDVMGVWVSGSKLNRALLARVSHAKRSGAKEPLWEVATRLGLALSVLRDITDLGGVKADADSNFDVKEVAEAVHDYMRNVSTKSGHDLMMVDTQTIVATQHLGWAVPIAGAINPDVDDEGKWDATAMAAALVTGVGRVPRTLMRGTKETRLAVLKAAVAQAGRLTPTGEYQVTVLDDRNVGALVELARSLGMFAWIHDGGVGIATRAPLLPVAQSNPPGGVTYNLIVAVEYLGDTVGCCIEVDHPTHTYLTEEFIPTHNTVTINNILASQIAAGAKVVIIDTPDKSVDFMWAKDYVMEGGWGCDSKQEAVAALGLAYEMGKRRAEIIRDAGVVKWLDLPKSQRFDPITIIMDEYAALTVLQKVPSQLPKDHPLRMEIEEDNLYSVQLSQYVNKIVAEQRAHGTRILLSSQVTSQASGMPPALRMKIGDHLLQGSRTSESARRQIFNDPQGVPTVPENVASTPGVSKGTGVAELEGRAPTVYKSYFATVAELSDMLKKSGAKTTRHPKPSPEDIARIAPSMTEDAGNPEDVGGGAKDVFDDEGW